MKQKVPRKNFVQLLTTKFGIHVLIFLGPNIEGYLLNFGTPKTLKWPKQQISDILFNANSLFKLH